MTDEALRFWRRAQTALDAARRNLEIDASTAASRAYYAALYAVSALLASEGKTFKSHTGVDAAVHRDLVHTGRWSKDLGKTFSQLHTRRIAADYDVSRSPSIEEAEEAVEKAERIVEAVRSSCPQLG